MIVQHIIWFLFNFHPKIPKFRFFSFFFGKRKIFRNFSSKIKKAGFPYTEANNIIFAIIKSFER